MLTLLLLPRRRRQLSAVIFEIASTSAYKKGPGWIGEAHSPELRPGTSRADAGAARACLQATCPEV
jgi:hypothetical protein